MPKTDFDKYLVEAPFKTGKQNRVKNITYPAWQLMGSNQVPEANYNIMFAWVTGIPGPNPLTTIHSHSYPEVLVFVGGDYRDPENLGAEIEFTLGGMRLTINSTGAIYIPAGVPHGQSTWRKFIKPHVKIAIALGAGISQYDPVDQPGANFESQNIDYSRYLVKKPAYEVIAGTPVKGRQGPSSMTLMNNNLVPGSNIYIEGGWVWAMPDPNPHIFEHIHDYEEIVIHFGSDYRQPSELGGEIEFCVGGQPLKITRTSAVFVPSGVKHGPLTWKKYDFPHLEMAIMPGAGTLDQADPGGHREKARRNSQNG